MCVNARKIRAADAKSDDIIISSKRHNSFPLKSYEKWTLIFTSSFFLVPSIKAMSCGVHYLSIISILTSIISILYWQHAIPSWRCTLDHIMAKLSFVCYFTTGVYHIRDSYILTIGWPICIIILISYYLSCRKWDSDSPTWLFYHSLFHLSVAKEQMVVLKGSFPQCS